ncbi:MAG TPA: alpha/beta fold hydrolase [Acidimicrobiales bacterium]|nr:alpha/beta fold hydrolase [Acidimicrobiales bacterium]
MPTIDLPHGAVNYRVAGPEDSTSPPVVFVHGFLADGALWSGVADLLAARGVRSYAPDWPLGAHRIALPPDADQSPRGVARQIHALLEELDLTAVTLVGNDTGGALCQFLLDTDASRVGRLVLTNCDAFDAFPPTVFKPVFALLRSERRAKFLAGQMRLRLVRQSWLGFGLLAKNLPADLTRSWIEPARTDAAVRRDAVRFLRAIEPRELLDVSTRLDRFDGPVSIVWGAADHAFTTKLGKRLQRAFTDAAFVSVPKSRTFVSLDAPTALADEIVAIAAPGRARSLASESPHAGAPDR